MTHLDLENLASEYMEGQLDATRRAALEAHLGECKACTELIADLRHALEVCRSAEDLEPTPWLISKILRATVGERKPTFTERVAGFLRPSVQPRLAYTVAMAVFSFSIIVNAAGINLRRLTLQDLNPRTWVYQAERTGNLLYARAEKFYYDLRVVYEIESRFRQLRAQPSEENQEAPSPAAPPGGSTDRQGEGNPQLASVQEFTSTVPGSVSVLRALAAAGRSTSR